MTQEQIDAIILDFLKAYKAWVANGAGVSLRFDRSMPLCDNLSGYLGRGTLSKEDDDIVLHNFKSKFKSDFPFGGALVSAREADKCTFHNNKRRMAWVNEQIERMEK